MTHKSITRKYAEAIAVVFLLALLVYGLSFARSVGWGDSADLALRVAEPSFNDFQGTSRDYALFRGLHTIWIHPLRSWIDPAALINFSTAVLGAVGVAITASISAIIGRSPLAAIGTGLALTFSHTFWLLSSTAEVYTFNIALSYGSLLLWLLWATSNRPWQLISSFALAGLSLSHHASGLVLALILIASTALLVINKSMPRPMSLLLAIPALMVASWLYLGRFLDALREHQQVVRALGLQSSANPFYDANPIRESIKLLFYVLINFPGPALIFAILGLAFTWKSRSFRVLPVLLWGISFFGAGIFSTIPDKFNIYSIGYPSVAMLTGLGFMSFCRWSARFGKAVPLLAAASLAIIPTATYAIAQAASSRAGLNVSGARQAPFRDNNEYFLWPPKTTDGSPSKYAIEAFNQLKPGDVLIADYTLLRPLLYYQKVKQCGQGVEIVFVEQLLKEGVDTYAGMRLASTRVFLATNTPPAYYQLDRILQRFTLAPRGPVHQILDRPPSP